MNLTNVQRTSVNIFKLSYISNICRIRDGLGNLDRKGFKK